jgi:hypothetical protein
LLKPELSQVPELDTSISSVDISQILFDTFGRTPSRFVPLDKAEDSFIRQLRDAIAPVYQPVYGDALDWLSDGSLVLGYAVGDESFAYPIGVLNFHEIVNDFIGGEPVLITYCPLCASGVVYSRELAGETLTFGNTSALYQSDLVMYDHGTSSYWFQTGGEAVVGELTGSRLRLLPSTTLRWDEWQELYPQTQVLIGTATAPEMFISRRYARRAFAGYQERVNDNEFAFPVDEALLDDRLRWGDMVLTVEIDGAATAYPLDRLGDAAINDEVAGQPVVVFTREQNRGLGAFSPVVAGQRLDFEYSDDQQAFIDRQTGSRWNVGGWAVSGSLSGAQLELLNTRRVFWFSIVIALPDVAVYQP